jgi:hypothetical protein
MFFFVFFLLKFSPGVNFPEVTIRDTVSMHMQMVKLAIGASRVACVIGGSMGGMHALEVPSCYSYYSYHSHLFPFTYTFSISHINDIKHTIYCLYLYLYFICIPFLLCYLLPFPLYILY